VAVQIYPIEPISKAPGIHPLTLKRDEPLLTCAFKFDLRCYTEEIEAAAARASDVADAVAAAESAATDNDDAAAEASAAALVGRCRITPSNPR
jgi:hypothetical protein